jgi:hypothetical protein
MERRFPELEIVGAKPLLRSADADLSAPLLNGFAIPRSYKESCKKYGYGRLFRRLILYPPMANTRYCDSLQAASARLHGVFEEAVVKEYIEYEPDGSPELVHRLVPFGISEDGHFFAWDPQEATGPEENRIFVMGPRCCGVWRGPTDLYEFVESCLDDRVRSVLGPGYEPLPRVFEPAEIAEAPC